VRMVVLAPAAPVATPRALAPYLSSQTVSQWTSNSALKV
jgi:hypothetical protein